MRIIKKYPNRRLYDTEESKYITLARVAEYAKAGEQIKVIDTETKGDITRGVLLQIILEQETSDQAMFSVDSLSEIVGYYGNTMPSLFNEYFQQSLKAFSESQTQLQNQFNADSMKIFEDMAKDNLDMWTNVQDNFLKMAGLNPISPDKEADGKED